MNAGTMNVGSVARGREKDGAVVELPLGSGEEPEGWIVAFGEQSDLSRGENRCLWGSGEFRRAISLQGFLGSKHRFWNQEIWRAWQIPGTIALWMLAG